LTLCIDNRIRVVGVLPDAVVRTIAEDFTYKNPDYAKARVFGFNRRVPEVVYTWQKPMAQRCAIQGEVISVPRGGYARVVKVLADAGETAAVQDRREFGGRVPIPGSKLVPRAYQLRLVEQTLKAFGDGINNQTGVMLWRSPQASGKTSAALMVAAAMQRKTLVVVSNTVLFEQWQRRVVEELGCRCGLVGGGKYDLEPPIVVAMQQSLKNVSDDDLARVGLVIGDEIQLFAAPTFEASIDRIPAAYRLGISGDERRADHKEFLIYDQFGPVAATVHHDELVVDGKIHEVEIRVVLTDFDFEWWHKIDALRPKPNETEERLRMRKAKMKIELAERLQDELAKDPGRKALIVQLVRECVQDAGNAIVLSTRREHCHIIDAALTGDGFQSGLLIGGTDYKDQFAQTLARFKAGLTQVAVGTYQAIGVGFDLPLVARGVCAAPAANGKDGKYQWCQYRGRFARTADGKADAALYYLLDWKVYGDKPLRHLLRWNARVVVRDGDQWVPGREWLKGHAHEETQRRDEPTLGFAKWKPAASGSAGGERLGEPTAGPPQAKRKRSEAGRG